MIFPHGPTMVTDGFRTQIQSLWWVFCEDKLVFFRKSSTIDVWQFYMHLWWCPAFLLNLPPCYQKKISFCHFCRTFNCVMCKLLDLISLTPFKTYLVQAQNKFCQRNQWQQSFLSKNPKNIIILKYSHNFLFSFKTPWD